MKRAIILASLSVLCLLQFGWGQIPRTISYQGVLKDAGGNLLNESVNLTFSIYAVASEGTALWSEPQTVAVAQGVFSVILGSSTPLDLDFDAQYWLETAVYGTPLSPRTRLTSSPYSFNALRADTAQYALSAAAGGGAGWSLTGNSIAAGDFLGTTNNQALDLKVNGAGALRLEPNTTSPNLIGGYSGNSVTSGVVAATISGGGISGAINQVTADYGTVSGGINNTASGNYATVGGGAHNIASGGGGSSTIGGGWSNTANGSWVTVGGGFQNLASGAAAIVGGGRYNKARGLYSVVSGGGGATAPDSNSALGDYSAVGGGQRNKASGSNATVGGGYANTASGINAFVGGGTSNTASGNAAIIGGGQANNASGVGATVSGGSSNTVSADGATVGGGNANTASGSNATVPGGYNSVALGNYSFATGYRARANHAGAFVWADSTNADFASTGEDQFLIRASGGVGIGTNNPGQMLTVADTIHSTLGGFMFPDGSVQATAAAGGGAGWSLTGNSITTSNFLGSTNNIALDFRVNNVRALRLERGTNTVNLVGGHGSNTVTSGVDGATISGGGNSVEPNRVTDSYGTVGGGRNNRAGDNAGNTGDRLYATVAGGNINIASGSAATVSGGSGNTASGNYATVSGGVNNTASGLRATVPGGYLNLASGGHSFAAGLRAKANHDGAFVWADSSTAADFASTATNQFLIRASGGVGIGTDSPSAELDVAGDVNVSGTLTVGGNPVVSPPIGSVTAWLKSFPNTPALPDGWMECNGQTLNDSESPYNGQIIPDLNGENRFLRGNSTSGGTGGSETHRHNLDGNAGPYLTTTGGDSQFRTQYESTLPTYYEVVWIMRVK